MLVGLQLFAAMVSLLQAAVMLRADHRRWENRLLATIVLIDVGCMLTSAFALYAGRGLTDPRVAELCLVWRIVIVYPTLAFCYRFPFGARAPALLRVATLAATAVALGLALAPATRTWFLPRSGPLFFLPFFLIVLYVQRTRLQRLRGRPEGRGAALVLGAVAMRWATELVTYAVLRPIGGRPFEIALIFNATAAVGICYAMATYAILRHQLFRVRGILAEVIFYGSAIIVVLGLVALDINVALDHVRSPLALRAALIGMSAIPLAAFLVLRRLGPRIERAILLPLDPARAIRKGALERAIQKSAALVEPEALVAATAGALAELTEGGVARFLVGPAAPPALARAGGGSGGGVLPAPLAADMLRPRAPRAYRPRDPEATAEVTAALAGIGCDLLVPVRVGGNLYGALVVVGGGSLDAEVALTVGALADNLALRLESAALFSRAGDLQTELDEARRLATLGAFAAAVAHDIRTPLTSIQMNVQMLRRSAHLPPGDIECLDIALTELGHLGAHVTEILDFAKPVRLHPQPLDVRDVAEEAAQRLGPIFAERELTLERRFATDLPLVRGDAVRIRQIVLNLLDNAAQASAHGAAIVLATRAAAPDRVAIEVSDAGRGISADELPKIFEPFFTTRPDGTGLGLAIVQKVVRAHGGDIGVRSTPGQGATFTVELPGMAGGAGAGGGAAPSASVSAPASVSPIRS